MLTAADKALLDELQYRFPLTGRPYRAVGRRLGLTEKEVVARLGKLHEAGIVRYTGLTFDLRRLRVVSTLAALSVPRGRIARAAAVINRYPQVSHNYRRTGAYPLWFTVSAASGEQLERVLSEIRRAVGPCRMMDLRTERVFKARALFRMTGHDKENL